MMRDYVGEKIDLINERIEIIKGVAMGVLIGCVILCLFLCLSVFFVH